MKLSFDSKILLVFGLGFLVAALTYWTLPYEALDLLGNGVALRWAMYSAIISLIAHLRHQLLSGRVAFWIGAGFLTAVSLRIIFDVLKDSSTHTLWPLELLIVLLVTFIPAFLVGMIFKSFKRTS